MSLRVWLPFTDGTLKQQGLDNAEATIGGTVNLTNAGKLGKCATFSTAGGGITLPATTMQSFTECSVAFWIKLTSWNASYATFFQAGLGGTPWNNYIFGILRNGTNSNLCFTLTNSSGTSSQAAYTTSNLNIGQWYHLAFTYKAGTVSTYIDGVLNKTYSTTYIPNFAGITHISIGRSTNNSGYQTNCNLNDFRIYDHCLSPMEVKQLSQGLILHYSLDRQGFGQENLITQAMIDAEPWKSAIQGNYTKDGKNCWILSNNILYSKSGSGANNIFSGLTYEANTQYTISFKWRDDYRTDGKTSSLYIRFKYSDGTYTQVICPKCSYWKEEVMTSTAGKTVSAITTTYGNGGNLLFTDLKLEKGTIKTPTSPIVGSDLYNSMGLDGTTEYDCSGFCNNGTRTGTFTYASDTSKYAVSQNCLGTNYIHLTPPSTEILTMAVWVNWKTIPSGQSVIFVDNGSGMGLGLMNTGILCSTSKAGSSYTFSKSSLVANTWYHFVVVKTGTTTRKLYINGVEQTATSNTSNWTFAVNELQLGKRSTTSDGFIGKLSDFRAYATALSPTDVKSLYQNCATIDPDGTIRGQIRS